MKNGLDIIGNAGMYVLTATQTQEIFRIISLVLSIVISILIIVDKVIKWYKDAKSDGKITKDEVTKIIDDTKDDIGNVVDKINEIKDKDKKDE